MTVTKPNSCFDLKIIQKIKKFEAKYRIFQILGKSFSGGMILGFITQSFAPMFIRGFDLFIAVIAGLVLGVIGVHLIPMMLKVPKKWRWILTLSSVLFTGLLVSSSSFFLATVFGMSGDKLIAVPWVMLPLGLLLGGTTNLRDLLYEQSEFFEK